VKGAQIEQVSILACVTGLALCAAWFACLALTGHAPESLAMLISAVGGFELYHFGQGLWTALARRRAGGR
jgi:hypothetical protein